MFIFKSKQLSCLFSKVVKQFQITNYSVKPTEVKLNIVESANQMPKLIRKPDEILVKQWWSQTPFDSKAPLTVPIFKFISEPGQEYTGKAVELDQSIFNVPLRRDLVHSYFLWRERRDKIQTHTCRNKATTRGSGIKPLPQKGSGKARQGNKRSPHLKKGGKVFGPRPRILRQQLNTKVRLQALKVMLSAKLAEGKLRIIDSESINEAKTKVIGKFLNKFDDYSRILIIHGYKPNKNFELAHRSIQKLDSARPDRLSVLQLLQNDRVFITLEGLRQLTQEIQDRTFRQFRLKHVEKGVLSSEKEKLELFPELKEKESKYIYDPSKPLQFRFKILQDYYEQYEQLKNTGEIKKYIEK